MVVQSYMNYTHFQPLLTTIHMDQTCLYVVGCAHVYFLSTCISKPALPYTVPHRLVQSHRAHRKVPTNTGLHRVHRVCTALYRPIHTPPICTGLVFPGLAQGLYTRIDNNAITILFQTLIALQILAYKATNILAITNYYIHGVVRDTT